MDFLSNIVAGEEGAGAGPATEIKESIRPNGLILNYPVISAETFAHAGSARSITGDLENADAFTDEKGIPISTSARETLVENDMLSGIQYEAFQRMESHDVLCHHVNVCRPVFIIVVIFVVHEAHSGAVV